jgi:serine/threonine-protein phosphatase 4 regulatory subunit 1
VSDALISQLPAICLALGQNRWSEIRPTFSALCNITHQRITVSLAASVHEIAKIIGPDLASQDLLLPFFEWLNGNDEIRGRALAQLPTFLGYLPADDAADTLQSVLAMWETGEFRNWRHRETLAGHAPSILMVLLPMGHGELALDLLRSGLFDTFQAIREAAIKVVRIPD